MVTFREVGDRVSVQAAVPSTASATYVTGAEGFRTSPVVFPLMGGGEVSGGGSPFLIATKALSSWRKETLGSG